MQQQHQQCSFDHPPVISLLDTDVVSKVSDACSTWGAFVLTDTTVDTKLQQEILQTGHAFFDLPQNIKDRYNLQDFGGAKKWRGGYMKNGGGERSVGGKYVDYKEGLYLGVEDAPDNLRVLQKLPTFGANVLPELPHMRNLFDRYHTAMTQLGNRMMQILSLGLQLDESYIEDHITQHDPVVLPRMFRYLPKTTTTTTSRPPLQENIVQNQKDGRKLETSEKKEDVEGTTWGIGRHSDYGLFTMTLTDAPGLEFEHPTLKTWHPIPFVEDAIIMNVGDLLDRLSSGRYVSACHRVHRLSTSQNRLSLPLFYDPSWNARMKTFPIQPNEKSALDTKERAERWANTKIACTFDVDDEIDAMEYSEFLAKKVAKVFPDLVPPELWTNIRSTSSPSTRHAFVERQVPDAIIATRALKCVQDFYKDHPEIKESHGWKHVSAVYQHADRAVNACRPPLPSGTAMEILVAALLHDVDDRKYFNHPKDDPYKNAKEILELAEVPEGSWDTIIFMIESVSCSKNGNSVPDRVRQGKEYFWLIPRWADRIEAVGAKGVVRCYRYNQEAGLPLQSEYSPRPQTEDEIAMYATPDRFQAYQDSGGTSTDMISHYYDKLLHVAWPPMEIVDNSYLEEKLRDSAKELIEVCLRFGRTGKVDEEYIQSLEEKGSGRLS